MISIIEGRPGQGKTLYGVDLIFTHLANKSTYVVSNIEISFERNDKRQERFQLISLDNTINDILNLQDQFDEIFIEKKLKRIVIIVDEIQTILNSRNWDNLPPQFQFFLQQHRHYRVDMVGLTQSIKRADVVMRELVQYFFRLYKIFVLKLPFVGTVGLIWRFEYDPDSIESTTGKYKKVGLGFGMPVPIPPYIFSRYDTYQKFPRGSQKGRRELREYVFEEKVVITPRLVRKGIMAVQKPELKRLVVANAEGGAPQT